MNIGDWLTPVGSIIVGILVWLVARQKNKITVRELDRQHSLKVRELKQRHDDEVYEKIQAHNKELWERVNQLSAKSDERERKAQEREDALNTKIDQLYKRVGSFRDYANRLRGQLISANLIPDPWPEER